MKPVDHNNDDLLLRYLSGSCSAGEREEVELKLKTDGAFRQSYQEYRFIWEQSALSASTKEADWQTLRQRMGFVKTTYQSPARFLMRIAAVALVFLTVASGLYLYWNVPGYGRWVVFETGASADSLVLPDASIVFLNRHSSLKFKSAFGGDERFVALDGEGYFEVRPDLNKPFSVDAGPVTVKVVGTAFHLNNNSDVVELNVTEGSVSLSNKRESTIVNQGEWALAGARVLGKGQVTSQNFLSWKTGELDFDKASLSEIATALTRHFPEIKSFRIEEGSEVLVTTHFKNESLEMITNELQVHFQKNFALNNGVLIISN